MRCAIFQRWIFRASFRLNWTPKTRYRGHPVVIDLFHGYFALCSSWIQRRRVLGVDLKSWKTVIRGSLVIPQISCSYCRSAVRICRVENDSSKVYWVRNSWKILLWIWTEDNFRFPALCSNSTRVWIMNLFRSSWSVGGHRGEFMRN